MKIIVILSILVVSQGQYIDDQSNDLTSTINSFSLITQNQNESTIINQDKTNFRELTTENRFDQLNDNATDTSVSFNYLVDQINSTYESSTWLSTFFLSSNNDFQSTTFKTERLFKKEKWFNFNQTNQRNSYDYSIFWRKINDDSTYIIRSEGKCLNRMCRAKLKYNGSLSNKNSGCLSFILWTRGQPVGQLWIEEDEEQEKFSQKIQLTNSSLRIEHSLKSKIKNLSIDARILFHNSKSDSITLSNLNVNWKGPCPKHGLITPIPDISLYQSTFEYDLTKLNTENIYETSFLTTNEIFDSTQDDYLFIQSSTIKFYETTTIINKRSFSFVDQSNIQWILTLIIIFCLLIILFSFLYGIWSIQGHYRFIWYIPFNSQIQFIARRSIRSSTRSENKIGTLEKLSNELFQIDFQQDSFDSFTTDSNRSTPSSFNAYF